MISIQPEDDACLFTNRWVFISVFVNSLTNKQYGLRYYLDHTIRSEKVIYKSRSITSSYTLSGATTVFWGGDNQFSTCSCHLQYLRVYLNWAVDSQDQLISLALMGADGNINAKSKIF